MISTDEQRGLFWLDTPSTSYVLQIYETGHLILLYWGKRLPHEDIRYLYPCYGGAFCPNLFDAPNGYVCPDTLPLEYPTFGLGDYHEPAFYARNPAGDRLCDLRYAGCRLTDGVQTVPGMPHVRAAQAPAQTLELTLRDPRIGVTVRLYYTVFADSDVIARCAAVRYDGGETLVLHQAASAHLELPDGRFEAIRLPGAQCREREIERTPLGAGRLTMVITVLTVNASWSDFLMPYLVLKDKDKMTVMVKIYDMANSTVSKDYQMVALLFAIIPPAIIFLFFSKYFTQGVSIGAVKG